MRARMKYLIEERGIEWFYGEVKKHTGFDLENGRIKDKDERKFKSGFRRIIETFQWTA